MGSRFTAFAVSLVTLALFGAPSANAAFPGQNGKLVVPDTLGSTQTNYKRLWLMNWDGSGRTAITADGVNSDQPAWSADGTKIAFSRFGGPDSRDDIWTINADGSGLTHVTSIYGQDQNPTWSPDGSKIAFQTNWDGNWEIYVVNADGSDLHNITNDIDNEDQVPTWSPDGTRVAFVSVTRNSFPNVGHIWLMDPDGSNRTQLPPLNPGRADWSPDGTKLAYTTAATCGGGVQCSAIHVMNANGTNDQVVSTAERHTPHWSPDGTKFVYRAGVLTIGTMNSDGTNAEDHPYPGAGQKTAADWQPVFVTGYPRPKGASPIRVPLVPAYKQCVNFNRNHGPPLAYVSCYPPRQESATLSVGTPDANGSPADSVGFARLTVVVGNPGPPADEADLNITASITDVLCSDLTFACLGGAGTDYEGGLLLDVPLRITDKLNGPSQNMSATVADTSLRVPFTCVATGSAGGSTCTVATSADAVVPGMVPEGKRSVWQPGQITIKDEGANGTGYDSCPPTCGDGDEAVFLRQGVFVP